MGERPNTHTPVTYDSCSDIGGPFYHGTKSALEVEDVARLIATYRGEDAHVGAVLRPAQMALGYRLPRTELLG